MEKTQKEIALGGNGLLRIILPEGVFIVVRSVLRASTRLRLSSETRATLVSRGGWCEETFRVFKFGAQHPARFLNCQLECH